MSVCCCSNPACIVNGCQALRQMQADFGQGQPVPCVPKSEPLTESDIRRIFQEELTKFVEASKK